jgi:hypothetical protein
MIVVSNRRKFVTSGWQLFCGLTAMLLFYNCGNKKKAQPADLCKDLSGLSDSELAAREQLGYVETSVFEDRACANCQLFVKSDQSLSCGSCLAMKGPVEQQGYCSVWAPVGE